MTHQPRPVEASRGFLAIGVFSPSRKRCHDPHDTEAPRVASRTPATTGFQSSLDRRRLREAIAVRRQRLAEREADLVAACEKAVAHGAGRHNLGPCRVEPLRRDRDATRTRVHAGDAPPDQGHRAAGTVGRAPCGPPSVCSMSAVPQNGANEDMCGSARASHRRLSPRLVRGLNWCSSRSRIPASRSRRARAPVMTGEAPSARAASVSLRAPIAHARREPCAPAPAAALKGGRSRHRFPLTAPEGTTPARSRPPSRGKELKE